MRASTNVGDTQYVARIIATRRKLATTLKDAVAVEAVVADDSIESTSSIR
jgi:hypothetical protein